MAEHTVMIWNVSSPCAAALACMWANHLARYSMRTQVGAASRGLSLPVSVFLACQTRAAGSSGRVQHCLIYCLID